MTTPTIVSEINNAQTGTASVASRHLTEIPKFIWIAEKVADAVYDSMSHDRLDSLRLSEIGELLDGPETLLKVVWSARWHDGHTNTYQFIIPGVDAEKHIETLPVRMQHRLMREVFRQDTILAI